MKSLVCGIIALFVISLCANEKNADKAPFKEVRQEIKEERQAHHEAKMAENKAFFAQLKGMSKEERTAALTKHFDQQFSENQELSEKNYQKALAAIENADLSAEVKNTAKQYAQTRYEKHSAFTAAQNAKRKEYINEQEKVDDKNARKENHENFKKEMKENRETQKQEMKVLRENQRGNLKK